MALFTKYNINLYNKFAVYSDSKAIWPVWYIIKNQDGTFDLYELKKQKLQKIYYDEYKKTYTQPMWAKSVVNCMKLELSSMPPEAKELIKYTPSLSTASLFSKIVNTKSFPQNLFNEKIAPVQTVQDSVEFYKFYNAKVYFPENIRDKRKQQCIEFLEIVKKYLDTKKVGYLITEGNIRFNKLSSYSAGEYHNVSKEIKISHELKHIKDMARIIIHELGHKYYYEYSNKKLIDEKYKEIKNIRFDPKNNPLYKELTTKDTVVSNTIKNAVYVVKYPIGNKLYVSDGQKTYIMPIDDILNSKKYLINGKETHTQTSNWFVTKYSTTNRDEWFAELFMWYVMNQVDGLPKEWISTLLS